MCSVALKHNTLLQSIGKAWSCSIGGVEILEKNLQPCHLHHQKVASTQMVCGLHDLLGSTMEDHTVHQEIHPQHHFRHTQQRGQHLHHHQSRKWGEGGQGCVHPIAYSCMTASYPSTLPHKCSKTHIHTYIIRHDPKLSTTASQIWSRKKDKALSICAP